MNAESQSTEKTRNVHFDKPRSHSPMDLTGACGFMNILTFFRL